MPCDNHNVSRINPVVSWLRAVSLLVAALLAAPAALALDSGDIFVTSVKGEVRVVMNGAARNVRAGSVLELPASLRTGRDGSVELRQGATTVSVGPDSALEFPALEHPGAPIDRIQQPRGNAFYNIGKREGRKLRVETPYLVGVVKGTQFNVSARDEATTISLFEGLLEIRATDESSVIDLSAGEIASRRRGDASISVIRMDSGKLPTTAPRPAGDGGAGPRTSRGGEDGSLVDRQMIGDAASGFVATANPAQPGAPARIDLPAPAIALESVPGVPASGDLATATVTANDAVGDVVDARADLSVDASTGGGSIDVSVGANLGAASAELGISTNVGVAANAISADVGVGAGSLGADVYTSTGVDLSGGMVSVDHETSVSVAAGPASVDVSNSISVDAGAPGISVDVVADVGVSAGPVSLDVGAASSVDVGAGIGADLTTGAAVDAGPVTADLDTTTSVDLGAGGTVAVDTGAALDVAGTDVTAGVTAGVDSSSGTVDLGVSVGDVNLGLGLDLGLGANEPATDTGSSTTPATDTGNTGTVDVGGLLDGLLRRPGRR